MGTSGIGHVASHAAPLTSRTDVLCPPMEAASFLMLGIVWAVWIAGIVRLAMHRRFGLAAIAFFIPFIGVFIAAYALLAGPPGSAERRTL